MNDFISINFLEIIYSCRKIKKLDNQSPQQPPQQQQQQQQQQASNPNINANKENLLTRTNKQHYHQDDHHQSSGFDYSSSLVSSGSNNKKSSCSPRTSSPINHDKTLSTIRATADQTSKIHVDVTQNPSDKLLLMCDSSEPSPRDLTDTVLTGLPTHKVSTVLSIRFCSPIRTAVFRPKHPPHFLPPIHPLKIER